MLREALASFRRRPGYDDPTRVDHVALSSLGFKYLGTVLEQSPRHIWDVLRSHLNQYLLRRLVFEHAAPPVMRDALFGADVGW